MAYPSVLRGKLDIPTGGRKRNGGLPGGAVASISRLMAAIQRLVVASAVENVDDLHVILDHLLVP
jgi:hypothetical protein